LPALSLSKGAKSKSKTRRGGVGEPPEGPAAALC
jgi:hypothetical protein